MRVAWLGPLPADGAGVPYMGTQVLRSMAALGAELECFAAGETGDIAPSLLDRAEIKLFLDKPDNRAMRRLSRSPVASFLAGQTARAASQARLVRLIAARHKREPYDVYYQFSQPELFTAARLRTRLPPIVLHPEVHAAGELRWHRREAHLIRETESRLKTAAARTMLAGRVRRQRKDAKFASLILAPSREFARQLGQDLGVPEDRIRVIPNPIDLTRFVPDDADMPRAPVPLLFVSRMSLRKGVEMVVELSRRLSDLAGQIEIVVIGGATHWSDYRPLLKALDPRTARYVSELPGESLPVLYRTAGALLQPSHYEPFALTVAEALASGVPVVASDAVGAAEQVDHRCCRTFPGGDMDAFETEVRALLGDLGGERRAAVRSLARSEAERLFDERHIAAAVLDALAEASRALVPSEVTAP
jgi:glycosyltransferase involved in cell wall biosynthesis